MFKDKKSEQESASGLSVENRLSQDFVVHNMPSPISTSTIFRQTSAAASGNHKKTGIIIISFGVLLIIGLIYGAYVLVIKPATKPASQPTQQNAKPVNPANTQNPVTETPSQNTTTVPLVEMPIVNSSSTATSTIEVPSTPKMETFLDTDGDGLSDVEEALFGSDPGKIDTDGDGNADLIELQSSYNPAGTGRLASSSKIVSYRNPSLKYSFIYPKDWVLKSLNENETVLITSADENYFIQIIHQSNQSNLDILDWYAAEFPDQIAGEARSAADGSWSGVYKADKSVFYLNDKAKKNIYVFSLGAVEGSTINYERLFEIVIDNFKLNTK
ncbi:MAG: thrombospondin type 3 repeat-containing protein [Candidatus Falkowbacteria bacterium]|nr:thrombospondin type 3 repeat-containing protein [Candidatus Falkowbacteria bacterium]